MSSVEWIRIPSSPVRVMASSASSRSHTIKLLSYNILSQSLINRSLFPFLPPKSPFLKEKHRLPLIQKILCQLDPDIAALQEVDTIQWNDVLEGWLREVGYDSVFQVRDKEEKSNKSHSIIDPSTSSKSLENSSLPSGPSSESSSKTGKGVHGLAFIWKRSKYNLIHEKRVDFDNHSLVPPPSTSTRCIAHIISLQPKIEELKLSDSENVSSSDHLYPPIIVSNTHLFWRPTALLEKLHQSYILLEEILDFISNLQRKTFVPPLFLCGDWNTEPHDPLYTLLTSRQTNVWIQPHLFTSYIPRNSSSPTGASTQSRPLSSKPPPVTPNESRASITDLIQIFSSSRYPHLASAYASYTSHDLSHSSMLSSDLSSPWTGEPRYTNYSSWKGTLDYIFYAHDDKTETLKDDDDMNDTVIKSKFNHSIDVLQVLKIPDANSLEPGIPNEVHPSDHVPIMAQFLISYL